MIEPAPDLAEGAQLFRHADSLRRYEQVHKDDKVKGAKPSHWNQAFPSETPGGLIGLLFHAASELALEKSPPWVARLVYEAATSLRSSVEIVAVLDRQTKHERHYDWLLAGPPGLVARRRTDTLIPGTYRGAMPMVW